LSGLAGWAARRARAVLAVSALLAIVAGVAATRLPTDAGTGTLVDSDTAAYRATQHVREVFGDDPVVILAEGDLQRLILTANLGRLLRLEGCLSAKVPAHGKAIPGPCAALAQTGAVKYVAGPATFLNEAVIQVDEQLKRLAAHRSPAELRELLLEVAAKYGITSLPSLGNTDFLATIVFDLRQARGTPKARLAYLFPNGHSAQIVVRLQPDLSESERHRALELIRAVVADTVPRKACPFEGKPAPCFQLHGGHYVVSGAPIVVDGLAHALKEALLVLIAVAVAVMALTLLAVFRSRFRLLPLALALAAAALTFGLLRIFGGSLTMASIAVLPILIGLAVDYAIQLQARYDEAVAGGLNGIEAARNAAAAGGPTVGIACLATAAGFLALQLSPTPMIRSFGLLLIVGVGIAFTLAMTAGFAALSLRPTGGGRGAPPGRGVLFFAQTTWREKLRARRKTQHQEGHPSLLPDRALKLALSHPQRVLGIGLALAIIGWAAGTQISTVSDIRRLAPQSLPAVRDLNELQNATGVSGELDVSVEAPDLTDPATIEWMAAFKKRVLSSNGFDGPKASCLKAEICPGPALSDFLTGGGGKLTRQDIRATVAQLPDYDLAQVAPRIPRTGELGHTALIAFGIRAQSLEGQQALIERVRSEVGAPGSAEGPPAGVTVALTGLPVIAAQSASDLSSSRYWLALAGIVLVALALLAAYRSVSRALVPLVPIVLATGWSSLVLWATGIPLNPMSAALGALTIAIATEFSVILAARFHEERSAGHQPAEALRRSYGRTGAAVLASGITAIAGFAVLIASEIQMLRDFGLVTVIDLAVALAGVLVVLPAALAWREAR
jgi:hydrophobe/amphiphile efflux-3 (HAE3) family protein